MAFSVYLLYSPSHDRTYVGQTKELKARLLMHNSGLVRSTKACRPWELVHVEEFETRGEAMAREKWLKSSRGRDGESLALLTDEARSLSVVSPQDYAPDERSFVLQAAQLRGD